MMFRRRLTLQLTPLLDLLLIVIFAQYMDVQEREAQTLGESARLSTEYSRAASELDDAQQERQQAEQQLLETRQQLVLAEAQATHLQTQTNQLQADLDRAIAQQRLLGELTSQLFEVPPELVSQAMTPAGVNPQQQQQLQQRFRELSLERSSRMIRHLLSYDELRKRIDLWELHIDATGWVTFRAGEIERGFRADVPDQFAAQLYNLYKSLPQPKSLVVILLSYGDARADVREAAVQALPRVTERMREDSIGRARFEYAVLGYQPDASR